MSRNVVIFGSGGHATVVFDILKQEGTYNPKCFYTLSPQSTEIFNTPILREQSEFRNLEVDYGIVGIGDNYLRAKIVNKVLSIKPNFKFISAVHPKAIVSPSVEIGKGTAIMAGAIIESGSQILDHVILNTSSSINHDCRIEDFVNISPNVTLGGMCNIGKFSNIGIGATVLNNITIEENSFAGAGSLVTKNLKKDMIYYGVPAKSIRQNKLIDSLN